MRTFVGTVRSLAPLALFLPIGFGIGAFADVRGLEDSTAYRFLVVALLAVGLYLSTRGIDVAHARPDARLILSVVTVGVLVKAALIGGVLALAFQDPLFLLLGVVVAQVDPLSVARATRGDRLSSRAQRILSAWASFDDPVTTVLAVYLAVVLGPVLGSVPMPLVVAPEPAIAVLSFLGDALLVGATYLLWQLTRRVPHTELWQYLLLLAAVVVAVLQFQLLAIAVIGLFLRPSLRAVEGWALTAAGAAAAALLGVLLSAGIDLRGVALGLAAYVAHVVVALAMTRRLPAADRRHLALAQQSGVTAIVLALLLETDFTGVVALVGPAIVTTNLIYLIANRVADRRAPRRRSSAAREFVTSGAGSPSDPDAAAPDAAGGAPR